MHYFYVLRKCIQTRKFIGRVDLESRYQFSFSRIRF